MAVGPLASPPSLSLLPPSSCLSLPLRGTGASGTGRAAQAQATGEASLAWLEKRERAGEDRGLTSVSMGPMCAVGRRTCCSSVASRTAHNDFGGRWVGDARAELSGHRMHAEA